jgi:predicted house-cleaning NTP pyrophosphatase (Maf/HAM1 superfamily)
VAKSGFVSEQVESILDWKVSAAEIEINLEIESLRNVSDGIQDGLEQGGIVGLPHYIIVADTMVEDPDDTNLALGQPWNISNAAAMLLRLSGRRHLVWSGTAVLTPDSKLGWRRPTLISKSVESATVEIDEITDSNLQELLESESWRGKAGAYDLVGPMRKHARLVDGEEVSVLGFAPTAIRKLKSMVID